MIVTGAGTMSIVSGATINFGTSTTANTLIVSAAAGATATMTNLLAATRTIGGIAGGGTFLVSSATLSLSTTPVSGTVTALPSFSGQIYSSASSATTGGLTVSAASAPGSGQIAGQAFSGNTLTFTGATTINTNATLALLSNASIAASSGVTVNTGGTLAVGGGGGSETGYIKGLAGTGSVVLNGISGAADTLSIVGAGATFSGVISGTYGNVALASGTQTATGSNTYAGVTTIASGALLILSGSGSLANSTVTVSAGGGLNIGNGSLGGLAGGGTVTVGSGNTMTLVAGGSAFTGTIAGTAGSVSITGPGTQTYTGTQTYSGTTTVGTNATLSLGTLGQISNSLTAGLTLTEPGTLALTSATTNTLSTTVSGSGTIALVSGASLAITSAASVSNVHFTAPAGASLDVTGLASATKSIGGLTGSGAVLVGSNTLIISDVPATGSYASLPIFSGGIYSTGTSATSGGLTVNASTTPTAGQIAGQAFSATTLTFTGATTIGNGATLGLFGGASIAASSSVTVSAGGTLAVGIGAGSGETDSIKGLAGTGSVVLNGFSGAPVTLAITTAGTSFGGIISGDNNSNISISGGGTQALTGSNTYSGTTTIATGTMLALNNGGSIVNSALNLFSGATLSVASGQSGQSSIIGGLTGSGSVSIANSTSTANTLIVSANGTTSFAGNFAATNGKLIIAGAGTQSFTGTLSQTGSTTINSAATVALTGGASAAGSPFTVTTGGTLRIAASGETGKTSTIGGLSGGGGVTIANSASAPNVLNIAASGGSYSGSIAATNGNVVISGTGTQTFTTSQSYTGNTTVNPGATLSLTTLSLISSSLAGNGSTVQAGGTLALAQSSTLSNTIAGSGVIRMASSGTLTVTSAANISNLIVRPDAGAVANLTQLVATAGKTIGGLSGSGNVLVGTGNTMTLSAVPVSGLSALPVFDGQVYASGTTTTPFSLTIGAASTPGAGQYAGQVLGSLITTGTTTINAGATLGLSGNGAGVTGQLTNYGTLAVGINGGYGQQANFTQTSGANLQAAIYNHVDTLTHTILDQTSLVPQTLTGRLTMDFATAGLTPTIGDFYPLIYSAAGWMGDFSSFYTSNDPSNACVSISRHPATLTPPAGAAATGPQAGPWAWNDVWQCGSIYFAEVMDPTRTYLAIQVVSANDVPEPGTLALLGSGLLGLGYARRQRIKGNAK